MITKGDAIQVVMQARGYEYTNAGWTNGDRLLTPEEAEKECVDLNILASIWKKHSDFGIGLYATMVTIHLEKSEVFDVMMMVPKDAPTLEDAALIGTAKSIHNSVKVQTS